MMKKSRQFFLLLKNKCIIFLFVVSIYLIILPLVYYIWKSVYVSENNYEIVIRIGYQVFYVLLSAIAYIIFMQDLVEEEGREIFYINKRMYLAESASFMAISCCVLHISMLLISVQEKGIKDYILFVIIENILVMGIMYFVLYKSSSSVIATAIVVALLLESILWNNIYFSVITTITEDYKEMLFQALLQIGYAIIFWALGGIENVCFLKRFPIRIKLEKHLNFLLWEN